MYGKLWNCKIFGEISLRNLRIFYQKWSFWWRKVSKMCLHTRYFCISRSKKFLLRYLQADWSILDQPLGRSVYLHTKLSLWFVTAYFLVNFSTRSHRFFLEWLWNIVLVIKTTQKIMLSDSDLRFWVNLLSNLDIACTVQVERLK